MSSLSLLKRLIPNVDLLSRDNNNSLYRNSWQTIFKFSQLSPFMKEWITTERAKLSSVFSTRTWLLAHLYGPHAWLWIFEAENLGWVGDVKQLCQSIFVSNQFPCEEMLHNCGVKCQILVQWPGRHSLPSVQVTQMDVKAATTNEQK